jgi:ABC-type transporter Mla subunit MlaD
MREGRRQLAASPVLIGAATVLVAIVAVFISYNANQGLPFVPTYKLDVEVPNAAKLVKGNEVRAGGFRVGVVDGIHAVRRTVGGKERTFALLELNI